VAYFLGHPYISKTRRTCSCFGDRTFAAATTRVWNSYRQTCEKQTYHTPASGGRWRHFLFEQYDHGAIWLFVNCAV